MRRYGFGDGESGTGDPGALAMLAPPTGAINDAITALNAQTNSAVNVDPITALESKLKALTPTGMLLIAGGVLVVVALMPSSGGRRR